MRGHRKRISRSGVSQKLFPRPRAHRAVVPPLRRHCGPLYRPRKAPVWSSTIRGRCFENYELATSRARRATAAASNFYFCCGFTFVGSRICDTLYHCAPTVHLSYSFFSFRDRYHSSRKQSRFPLLRAFRFYATPLSNYLLLSVWTSDKVLDTHNFCFGKIMNYERKQLLCIMTARMNSLEKNFFDVGFSRCQYIF